MAMTYKVTIKSNTNCFIGKKEKKIKKKKDKNAPKKAMSAFFCY
jgi:hypothetical protein